MNYPWCTDGASGGFENENDHHNSYYDYYICCDYCGDYHSREQCPHALTLEYLKNDFARAHFDFHDNTCSLGWNHEQPLSWDQNCSFPSYVSHPHMSHTSHVDETTPIDEEELTTKDLLLRLLDGQNKFLRIFQKEKINDHAQNGEFQVDEMISNLEHLKQKEVFNDISKDPSQKDEVSSETLTMGNEDVILEACEYVGDDCELEINEEENNTECPVEVSILEPNFCCFEQENSEEIPSIYDLDPPIDILTLTDESQIDFIGCSKYLGGMDDECEKVKFEPAISLAKTCTPKSFFIEEMHVSYLNELPLLLKYFCHRRNEDKVVLVFDTYD